MMKLTRSRENALVSGFTVFAIILSALSPILTINQTRAVSEETQCSADIDVVMTIDISASMVNGETLSSCEWKEPIAPYCGSAKTQSNVTESWCLAHTQGSAAPCNYPPIFTPAANSKIADAKTAVNSFLDNLGANDQSALVSFNDQAFLNKVLSNDHVSTKSLASGLSASGSTNIGYPIQFGTAELGSSRSNPQATKAIILLTDGKANRPYGNGFDENQADIDLAIGNALIAKNLGYKIFTIGLGSEDEINEDMLREIASVPKNYYHAPTSSELQGIYDSISAKICDYSSISGCKYKDTNNNGAITDETEKLSGWEINLGGDATLSQQTDESGCYSFSGLEPGTYSISETIPSDSNWIQTYSPNPNTFTIDWNEQIDNVDFGNYLPICGNGIVDADLLETCDEGTDNGLPGHCSATCTSSFEFPSCENLLPTAGDRAHYTDGMHQIVGESSQREGSDDVYTLSEINFVQCFCPIEGTEGIQTNWLRSDQSVDGWFFENGLQWGLENFNYAAQNLNFTCEEKPAEPICGNGIIEEGEVCDDENTASADGCSSDCQIEENSIKISASKIVCDDESLLPNWGVDGTQEGKPSELTASTAREYVDQHEGCHFASGWNFQWGNQDVINPADDFYGEANGGWNTFGQTSASGTFETTVSLEEIEYFKLREVLQPGYIPFTYFPDENNDNNVSAEFYCGNDIENYDNYEFIENPVTGETYHCIAFNAELPKCSDSDEDGVCDKDDNCVNKSNPSQKDSDKDGVGDVCDTGTISGCEYKDIEDVGTINQGEQKMSGWQIQLIGCPYSPLSPDAPTQFLPKSNMNLNPQPGETGFCSVIKTTTTGEDGCYSFTELDAGDYGVSEVSQTNWTQTLPTDDTFYYFNLANSENAVNVDFLNQQNEISNPQCSDNLNNDQDELIDANDPGCHTDGNAGNSESYDPSDNDETDNVPPPTVYQCSDGSDNDQDGLIDASDPGCHSDGNAGNTGSYISTDDNETDVPPPAVYQCGDGVDNDQDGFADSSDPGCHSDGNGGNSESYVPTDNDETNSPAGCISNCGGNGGGGGGSAMIVKPSIIITKEKVKYLGDGKAKVTWETNIETTEQVVYGDNSITALGTAPKYGYDSATSESSGMKKGHSAVISGLTDGIIYYFRPVADRSGSTGEVVGKEVFYTIEQGEVKGITDEKPAPEAQCNYLLEYIKLGRNNNPVEVEKLERFLNEFEGENLLVNGIYEQADFDAVSRFQKKYLENVLSPWEYNHSTGYVYITTKKKINEIYCERDFPLSLDQLAEIRRTIIGAQGQYISSQQNGQDEQNDSAEKDKNADESGEVKGAETGTAPEGNVETPAGENAIKDENAAEGNNVDSKNEEKNTDSENKSVFLGIDNTLMLIVIFVIAFSAYMYFQSRKKEGAE